MGVLLKWRSLNLLTVMSKWGEGNLREVKVLRTNGALQIKVKMSRKSNEIKVALQRKKLLLVLYILPGIQ